MHYRPVLLLSRLLPLLLALALCAAGPARAQQKGPQQDTPTEEEWGAARVEGTYRVSPHSTVVSPELCTLEFSAFGREGEAKTGAMVLLKGSLSFGPRNGVLAYLLRLELWDNIADKPTLVLPAYAFWKAPVGPAPTPATRGNPRDRRYALFLGNVDQTLAPGMDWIFKRQQVMIGYQRQAGDFSVLTTLDLTVSDSEIKDGVTTRSHSNEAVQALKTCLAQKLAAGQPQQPAK